jgi:NAD(P)-dependent dehydrogenase (short-subunit alcohol dehydrogenase family)
MSLAIRSWLIINKLCSAGIGYSTVKHLARHGAKVYMAARNQSKAEAAIAQLKAEGLGPGNGEVIWLELDLVDPQNAKKAAEEFIKREKRLDVLSLYMVS